MTNLAFNEFIEQHVKEPKIDWEAKKSEWIRYLSEFYNKIEYILLPYTKDGKLQLYRKQIELDEEYIGKYRVDAIDILLGNAKVTLTPIGTNLIAAKGRVDMEGAKGIVRFVLVPKETEAPTISVVIKDTVPEEQPINDWVWKISTPPPKIRYLELNSDSFKDALMSVVDG